jgi:hypothetical protein
MGINRNVARKVVFGLKSLDGLEIHHLHTLQGTKLLQYFMGHLMCQDGNGNLMRMATELAQLEVGTYEPFLFLNYASAGISLLNKTWLTSIWEHLSLCKVTITTTLPWLPLKQREHDTSLMAMATELDFTDTQKK